MMLSVSFLIAKSSIIAVTGIEGVESVVEEFFSENGLTAIRTDIPGVKVVNTTFLIFTFTFCREESTAPLTTESPSLLAIFLTSLLRWSARSTQFGTAALLSLLAVTLDLDTLLC